MVSGARRNEDTRRAILAATLAVTAELGYERASIEAIARRAASSKQTIYRWWPSKAAVLHEALQDAGGASAEFPDSGDLTADLRTQMTGLITFFNHPAMSRVFRGLIAAAQSDPEVAETQLRSLIGPRRRAAAERLATDQRRGRLAADVDVELLIDLLYAPLYYRLLITGDPLTTGLVEEILQAVLAPVLTPAPAAPSAPPTP
jgi:AcrR family transcriptional regulator